MCSFPSNSRIIRLACLSFCAFAMLGYPGRGRAETAVNCGAFAQGEIAGPAQREDPHARQRAADINEKAKARSYSVLFLGDSITERWDDGVWTHYFSSFDPLNAGVSGDRTEHLLWRIENGNLDHQRPRAVVLLIGTNDLGHGRTPEVTAEGIRRVLVALREKLPDTAILLEGLWPRIDIPRLSGEIDKVNALISRCDDGARVTYSNLGRFLLDGDRRLTRAIAFDGLHLSAAGYQLVSPKIGAELRALFPGEGEKLPPTLFRPNQRAR
jgi:lysophospholipase L1-like esterase